MESFVPALLKLKDAPVEEVIPKLYATFHVITQMNEDEVVAAYQTLETVAASMNATEDPMAIRLKGAITAQMTFLAGRPLAGALSKRFEAVTGRKFNWI